MKAIVTTSVTVTTQWFTPNGDHVSTPVVFSDKQEFDSEQEADAFVEHIDLWVEEYPKPNGDFHPFRRVKTPATEEKLIELLDEIHGPDDLWIGNPSELNPHGYNEVGDY